MTNWGESIKPRAQQAFNGIGEYNAGSWCKFCKANGICKAQAETQLTALDDFKGIAENPALLNPEQIGDALKKGALLTAWYSELQKVALEKILEGSEIPGYKVVEGRSLRTWTNQDEALNTLKEAGIEQAILYDFVPKSLAQLEKVLGKETFTDLVGKYVTKPTGKPTLVTEDDKRPAFSGAVADFAAVANKK